MGIYAMGISAFLDEAGDQQQVTRELEVVEEKIRPDVTNTDFFSLPASSSLLWDFETIEKAERPA